ncbi:MAG: Ig-like domain-containing protein [Roseburia sp.]|nr:Ig-like domain-containing protein [Roseburia sp.]
MKKKLISTVLICLSLLCAVCAEDAGKPQEAFAYVSGTTGTAVSGGASNASSDAGKTPAPFQTQAPELSTEPSAEPAQTGQPGSKKKETPLAIKNKEAHFYSGGQKGIRYGKVKKGKLYHIDSYVSDPVKLLPTRPSTFKITGGASKKDITSGKVKVSGSGTVTCTDRAKDKKQYAIVQVKAKDSGESIYVYVYFAPRLYAKSPSSQVVYQGKSAALKYNYPYKNLRFVSSNPKVARVNKKGIVTARKKGSAVVVAQVKKSGRNIAKTKITVKEEPWLVNEKDTLYSYEDMTKDLKNIAWKYRGKASLKSIGSSEDGRTIWCLRIGNPSAGKKIVIDAGIHAREWLNPLMIVHKCEEILRQYADYKGTLKSTCLYVVPMINPDGVTISQYGFGAIRSEKLRKICQKTKASARTWKANARGVNLNFNFPGGWNPENKPKKPDGISYPGKKAASEKETKAMMAFINGMSGIRGALNYHSTGSILYWNYNVEGTPALYEKQRQLAQKVNSFTRYRLMPKSISTDPNGGFGDWLIYNKKIPNVTVETGSVMCPLPHSQLKKITRENTELLTWFVGEYVKG